MKNFKVVSCGSHGHGVRSVSQKLFEEMKNGRKIDWKRPWNHNFYYTNASRVELISISGESGFLGPTIGAFQTADHVNVVIDVTASKLAQSMLIIKTALKVSPGRISVVLNKMDKVFWDEDLYLGLSAKIRSHILDDDQTRVSFVPASGSTGGNVFHPEGKSQWYSGESVYQTWKLSFLHKKRGIEKSNQIISLQKGEMWQGQWAAPGYVFRGKVSEGDQLLSLPDRKKVEIRKLYVLDKKMQTAEQGRCVTLVLDAPIDQAFLVKDPLDFHVGEQITARFYNWGQPLEKEKSFTMSHPAGTFQCKVHDVHMQNSIGDGVLESVVNFKVFPKLTYQRALFSRQLGAFRIVDEKSKKYTGLGVL